MKKGDILWFGIIAILAVILAVPSSRQAFIEITESHKLISGFCKFAVLASMGGLLAGRIRTGNYKFPSYFLIRAVIWGVIGIWITLSFVIYDVGVNHLLSSGLLPGAGYALLTAFLISVLNNLSFAPSFMLFHNLSDAYLDLKAEGKKGITARQTADKVDWTGFVSFTIKKTLIFFWIPAHTITFMLPSQYRVLFAAALSIALGILLNLAPKKERENLAGEEEEVLGS